MYLSIAENKEREVENNILVFYFEKCKRPTMAYWSKLLLKQFSCAAVETITETVKLPQWKRKTTFVAESQETSCFMLIYGLTLYEVVETSSTSSSYNSNMLLTH